MRAEFSDIRAYVGRPFPNDLVGEREWIRSLYQKGFPVTIVLVIEEIDSNTFAGILVASQIHYVHRNASIGAFLHPDARRKGYFREGQILFFAYLFNELNLHKITTQVVSYNHVSVKVLTSMGFKQDGLRKEQIFQNGQFYDGIMLSLMARDFFTINPVAGIIVS